MAIAKVTTHPMKHMHMEKTEDTLDACNPQGFPASAAIGALRMTFELANAPEQRHTAQMLAETLSSKAIYLHEQTWKSVSDKGYYEVAGWTIIGNRVTTAEFSLGTIPNILSVLATLRDKGYAPEDEVTLLLAKAMQLQQVRNLCEMLEAKRERLISELPVAAAIRVLAGDTVALGIPLSAFDLAGIEAAAHMLYQTALQAAETGNKRIKSAKVNATLNSSVPKRVAAYCRVSTEMELQEGSFELQMRYYRELVAANPDMELVDVYGDKGKTGRSIAARPAFQRMLIDCEAGKIDMILTKSISRFARNLSECIATLRRLKELGIPVLFEKENINSMEERGELILSIFAAIAQEESNSISQNILWANERRNADGKPHFKPSYGYIKARGDWEWHVNEAQARRVRLAFQMAEQGDSYCDIRQALNAMEYEEKTNLKWTYERLRYLLTNENYTGDYLTNRRISVRGGKRSMRVNRGERTQYFIEGHHEPLVSRERFETVQEKLCMGALHSRDMSHLLARPTCNTKALAQVE